MLDELFAAANNAAQAFPSVIGAIYKFPLATGPT